MKDSDSMDAALARILDDMDDLEGKAANAHSLEECPDPLTCTQHDEEMKDNLTPGDKKPAADLTIVVGDGMMPKLGGREAGAEGEEGSADEGLSADEAAELRKILSK